VLRDLPLFRDLSSLRLPDRDYVIAGSGPLLAAGLRFDVGDLDIVAIGSAWECAATLGTPCSAPFGGASVVNLCGGKIEVIDRWFPWLWPIEQVFAEADRIECFNFVSLPMTRQWKASLNRDKDREDVAMLAGLLDAPAPTAEPPGPSPQRAAPRGAGDRDPRPAN
jgi:hypothetical protein